MKRKNEKTAWIVAIGNELTTGLVQDTNSSFIAAFLMKHGYFISRMVCVPDIEAKIISELHNAIKKADIAIVTGGLGLTHDDITKKTLSRIFKSNKTIHDHSVLKDLQEHFDKMGRTMPTIYSSYADIPDAAIAIPNKVGLAPGLFFKNMVLALPGVPHEARHIISTQGEHFIPFGGSYYKDHVFRTAGVGETNLSNKIKDLKKATNIATVAFLPNLGNVDIRIVARGQTAKTAEKNLQRAASYIRKDIGKHVWGIGNEPIEFVIGRLLKEKGGTLCTAESCTGGGIGKRVTNTAGSSGYFVGGVIAYSNKAKQSLIGVPAAMIKKFGAVSPQTAVAMAHGAKKRFGANIAISTTGIAGPGGGTKEKPVGMVYIAVSSTKGETCRKFMLTGKREEIRERACFEALFLLYQLLTGTLSIDA
jgi:nicotinamide-nucleotide amidase